MAEADTPQAVFIDMDGDAILAKILGDEALVEKLRAALAPKETEDAGNQEREVEGSVQEPEGKPDEIQEDQETEEVQEDKQEEVVIENSDAQETEVQNDEATIEDVAPQTEDSDEDAEIDVSDVDWYLLNIALDHEIGDARLSAEAREKLKASDFCGPERSFPVPDCAHVTAARRLIGRAKLSEDQKKRVLACVDRKAKAMSCDSENDSAPCGCDGLQGKIDQLMSDYQESLKLATKLQAEVDSLKEKLALLDTADEPSQNDDKNVPSVKDIKPVEDESASSSQSLADSVKELGAYEKKIVSRFQELRDQKGERAAYHFLNGKIARGHLPRTFDITPHIQENE